MKHRIIIDKAQSVYYTGQTLSGRVVLELSDEISRVRSLSVTFRGWASVRWSEGGGKHRRTYMNNEEYFSLTVILFGEAKGKSQFTLAKGHHSYPFQFVVPIDVPSSYESAIGNVCYCLESKIDRAWGFDKKCMVYVTIHRPLDLNCTQGANEPSETTNSKTVCCLCCQSGQIDAQLRLDRRGHVPGENLVFSAQIDNNSTRAVADTRVFFIMQVSYIATKVKLVENVLSEVKHKERISAGATHHWVNEKIPIPPVPPSHLDKCNIISITYLLKLVVNPAGPAAKFDLPAEVIIGDIPLVNVAHRYGVDVTGLQRTSAVAGIDSSTILPGAIPSYAESPFGRPFQSESAGVNSGHAGFSPVYSYFKWDQTNPSTRFSV